MDPKATIQLAKKQLKGVYLRYTGAVFLCTLFSTLLNLCMTTSMLSTQPQWFFPYFFITVLLIVFRNTVYFLFIKRVRNEVFTWEDVKYSFTKLFLHLATAILFELLQMGILLVVQLLSSLIVFLSIPLLLLLQVLLSSVSVFIAFAIYDGAKGAVNIVNGSFRLLKKEGKNLFMMAMPFLIWLLIYQLVNNLLVVHMVTTNDAEALEMLLMTFQNQDLQVYVYGFIALEFVHAFISSMLLCVLYTAYANVYEKEYTDFYPFSVVLHTNVIDVNEIKDDDISDKA